MTDASAKQNDTTAGLVRIAVVITPCSKQRELRALIVSAAENAGYVWRDDEKFVGELSADSERRVLLLCSDPSLLDGIELNQAVVIFGAPGSGAQSTCEAEGLSYRDGVIYTARHLALATEFVRRMPEAKVVLWDEGLESRAVGFASVFAQLDLTISPQQFAQLISTSPDSAQTGYSDQRWSGQSSAAAAALSIYRYGLPQPGDSSWWGRELFYASTPGWECPEAVDITGRARVLIWGPYVALPAGRWLAKARFKLSDGAAKRHYIFEFVTNEQPIKSRYIWPTLDGAYEVTVEGLLPSAAVAEIRISVGAAALHGNIHLDGISIEYLGAGIDDGDRRPDSPHKAD